MLLLDMQSDSWRRDDGLARRGLTLLTCVLHILFVFICAFQCQPALYRSFQDR